MCILPIFAGTKLPPKSKCISSERRNRKLLCVELKRIPEIKINKINEKQRPFSAFLSHFRSSSGSKVRFVIDPTLNPEALPNFSTHPFSRFGPRQNIGGAFMQQKLFACNFREGGRRRSQRLTPREYLSSSQVTNF